MRRGIITPVRSRAVRESSALGVGSGGLGSPETTTPQLGPSSLAQVITLGSATSVRIDQGVAASQGRQNASHTVFRPITPVTHPRLSIVGHYRFTHVWIQHR